MRMNAAKRHDDWAMRRPARRGYPAPTTEAVIGGAVLVTTAFRLRDPEGLATALRALATAVADWEDGERAGGYS